MAIPKINENLYVGNTGKQLKDVKTLVAEITLTSPNGVMEITGLNIIRDGGIYDIIIEEFSNSSTGSGHYLQINGMGTGYNGRHRYVWHADYTQWINTKHTACLGFTNGWSMGTALFYTVGTLIFFNKDWLYFQSRGGATTGDGNGFVDVQCDTYVVNKYIQNVTSLRVICTDGDTMGVGSSMKIYKRV